MSRGRFITFEGVEGAGKSTHARLFVEALKERGVEAHLTREPGGCPLAEKIRVLILEECEDPPVPRAELLLMQAARAQHVDRVILPKLEAGVWVVSDRFYHSTLAYQMFARGLDPGFTRAAIEYAIDGAHPDATVILDLPVEEGLARQGERNRMEDEGRAFHQAVREAFLSLAAEEPQRVHLVDASGSVEEVRRRVMQALEPLLKDAGRPGREEIADRSGEEGSLR